MLSTRDLARGQAPRTHCDARGSAARAIGGCGACSRFYLAQRAGDKEADREGDYPSNPRADRSLRCGARFCLPGTISSNCMTTISSVMPREYVNRFEMKTGLYRVLRDYNGGLPIPAERSTACIKDKLCFMSRCRKFGIATAPIFLSVAKGKVTAVDWSELGPPGDRSFREAIAGSKRKKCDALGLSGFGTISTQRWQTCYRERGA